MDHLWSPWRYRYVQREEPAGTCIFCQKPSEGKDEENFIVYRGRHNFALLNVYPYTTGHLLIAPYEHVARLADTAEETLTEMILLARRAERHLQSVYRPSGLNLGMNLGESAGAGIAGHIHLHILPRWHGDVNFMTTIAETRVLPESLEATYEKLVKAFRGE